MATDPERKPKHYELAPGEFERVQEMIMDSLVKSEQSMSELLADVAVWRGMYRGETVEKNRPWENCSNVPPSMIGEKVDDVATQITRGVFGVSPIIGVDATTPRAQQSAPRMEQFADFWLTQLKMAVNGYMLTHETLVTGTAHLAVTMEPTGSKLPVRKPQSATPDGSNPLAQLAQMFPQSQLDSMQPPQSPDSPSVHVDRLDMRPRIDVVPIEDVRLCPSDAPSYRQAQGLFRRIYIRWEDLRAGEKRGWYDLEDVEESWLSFIQGNRRTESQQDAQDAAGISATCPADLQGSVLTGWEGTWKYRPTDSEKEVSFIVVALPQLNKVIRFQKFPYKHNLPLLARFRIWPMTGNYWGQSMVEKLRGVQMEKTTLTNMIIDGMSVQISPPVKRRSGRIGEGTTELIPGAEWSLMSMDDAQPVMLPPLPIMEVFRYLSDQRADAERLTGSNDLTTGRPAQAQRTLGELNLAMDQGGQRNEVRVKIFEEGTEPGDGIIGIADRLFPLFRQFYGSMGDPIAFAVTGSADGLFPTVGKEDFDGEYSFVARGNSVTANPQLRYQQASAVTQFVQSSIFANPISMNGFLKGCIGLPEPTVVEFMKRDYAAERKRLEAARVNDPETYIGKEPDEQYVHALLEGLAKAMAAMAQAQGPPGGTGAGADGADGGPIQPGGDPSQGAIPGGQSLPSGG